MHAKCAVNKQLSILLAQSGSREFNATLKEFGWLRLKIVIRPVIENFDSMSGSQLGVVKFDLHIEDVSHSCARDLLHVLCALDAPTHCDSIHDPGHIHRVQ